MMTSCGKSDGNNIQSLLRHDRRFYWKSVAILECITILYMLLNNNTAPVISSKDASKPVPRVTEKLAPAEIKSNLEKQAKYLIARDTKIDKLPFSSNYLKMFQSQTNISLVWEIQRNWLRPPSERAYNITPDTATDMTAVRRLHNAVLQLFNGKKNGFFIECGAFDGVSLSNTLHLEQNYSWTGLLVEADPKYFNRLVTRQRKAWTINACLSITLNAEKVRMSRMKNADALSILSELADNTYRKSPNAEEFEVQCFPLTSILSALGQTLNIDYFSLDVEGAELRILKTIPWDFVYIKVLSLEAKKGRFGPIREFLATKNYEFIKSVNGPWITDHIFVHKQFIKEKSTV